MLDEIIYKSYTTIYNGVCLDIDKTITHTTQGQENVPDELCKVLARILQYKNYVCFITGRGHNSAKQFLVKLRDKIQNTCMEIPFSSFKRVTCITGNGVCLYYTLKDDMSGFLEEERYLIEKESINNFNNCKANLREDIAVIISKILGYDKDNLVHGSEKHSRSTSIRFPVDLKMFKNQLTKENTKKIIGDIQKLDKNASLHITTGIYENNFIFELSLATKGNAIKRTEEFLGISTNKMLRIGDQGDEFGNDFTMLNTPQGFSVDKLSTGIDVCFPVISNRCIHLQNTDATEFLLKNLKIFPSVYLDKPDRNMYEYNLANAERKAKKLKFEYIGKYSK